MSESSASPPAALSSAPAEGWWARRRRVGWSVVAVVVAVVVAAAGWGPTGGASAAARPGSLGTVTWAPKPAGGAGVEPMAPARPDPAGIAVVRGPLPVTPPTPEAGRAPPAPAPATGTSPAPDRSPAPGPTHLPVSDPPTAPAHRAPGAAAPGGPDPPAVPPAGVPAPGAGYAWPLHPVPVVWSPFRAPDHRYGPGHRGADLLGSRGQPVLAARAGVVVYAGLVGGREVVSVLHDDGLRTTYEPVHPLVRSGAPVAAGAVLGSLLAGHRGCPDACLHWGVRRDRLDYLDPLVLVRPTRIRLLPVPPG